MRRLLLFVLIYISLVACKELEQGFAFEPDDIWIGLWQNDKDVVEIRQNGTGRWMTNEGLGESGSLVIVQTFHSEKFSNKTKILEGVILIQDEQLKIGTYKGDEYKKIFSIDEYPTESVNDSGDAYTFIVLNRDTLIKWY